MEQVYDQQVSMSSGPVSRLLVVARWIAYVGVALLPLWFLPFTNSVLELNKKVFLIVMASVALILYLIDLVKSGKARFRVSSWYVPLVAFLGVALVTTIFSVLSSNSIFGIGSAHQATLMSWIAYVVLFFLLVTLTSDMGARLHQIVSVSAAVTLLIGMLQLLGVSLFPGQYGDNAFNTIGSVNQLAFFAALIFPIFLVPARYDRGWFSSVSTVARWVGGISAFVILVGVNWFYIWVVAFIGLLAYLGFSAMAQPSRRALRFFVVPMAVIIIGIFLSLISFDGTSITTDNIPAELTLDQATSYSIAMDALEERPIGYGPESFFVAYDQFKPDSIANSVFYQTRFGQGKAAIPTMITEGGVLMVLAIILLIIFVIRQLLQAIQQRMHGSYLLAAVWSSLIAFMVMLFLYPLNITYMILFVVLLALLSLLRPDQTERVMDLEMQSKYAFIGSVAFIIGLVLVLVGGYVTFNQFRSDVALAKALRAEDPASSIEHLITSADAQRYNTSIQRLLSQALIAQVGRDLEAGPQEGEAQEAFRQRINSQIDFATRTTIQSTDIQPADSENWMNQGLVYQNLLNIRIEGSGPFAISRYQEALKRNPANPLAYFRIGTTYMAMANQLLVDGVPLNNEEVQEYLAGAEESFQQAVALYQDYGPAVYNLGLVYERRGEVPQAIDQFEQLVISSPQDPSLLLQLGLLYYRNDQKDSAIGAWEQAVRLFPEYSNARWYLSLAYEERGELEAALAQVEAIEEVNPENELVLQRRDQLESGLQLIPDETGDVLEQEPLN